MRPIRGLLGLLLVLLIACAGQNEAARATPVTQAGAPPRSTPTLAAPLATELTANPPSDAAETAGPFVPTQSPTPPLPDSGWEQMRAGLERRILQFVGDEGQVVERVYLLRIDPAGYRFQVAYHPGEPQTLLNWQRETGALVVINGGYFNEAYEATALVISDGQSSGVSYEEFAGMFAVSDAGPEVRWLGQQPYDPNEALSAGLQSFPLLVKPGGLLGFPEETGRLAQRTVVAQDNAGRILFLVTSGRSFTLHELANFLIASDLELDVALNLDGGPSTGIILAEPAESVSPQAYVPAVIVVYPDP